jgi:hypothetical protein
MQIRRNEERKPMTTTALIVNPAPAGPRKLTPAQPTGDNARCRALFASSLQRSDAPGADAVAEAIRATVQQLGADGCTGRMAQEFGDHPEAATARMRWVRSLLPSWPQDNHRRVAAAADGRNVTASCDAPRRTCDVSGKNRSHPRPAGTGAG